MSKIDWKVGDIGTTHCYGTGLRIFAVDDDWLAVADEHTRFWVHSSQFFPIKTQEQIEAEERSKAIAEMALIVKNKVGFGVNIADMEALYDAGYRKQGEAK